MHLFRIFSLFIENQNELYKNACLKLSTYLWMAFLLNVGLSKFQIQISLFSFSLKIIKYTLKAISPTVLSLFMYKKKLSI